MTPKTLLAAAAAVLTSFLTLTVAAAEGERIVVPLSEPSKPARLKVDLIAGSITVEAWDGKEVIVEGKPLERIDEDDDEDSEAKAPPAGMKRLVNPSIGFEVAEEGNEVSVRTEAFRRPLELTIKVPRRTDLRLSTVNDGDIRVTGVDGDHELKDVNGGIRVDKVAGSVVAETINGEIEVHLTRVTPDRPLAFSTLNGDIQLTLPASYRANVSLRSDNGEVYSDFDVQAAKAEPRVAEQRDGKRFRVVVEQEIRGTIGGGGAELRMQTFNGDLYLKKGG